MDLTCTSVQRNGERCTAAVAQPGATMCAHHERMARLLAMAPKKTAPSVQTQSVAAVAPQIDNSLTFGLPGEVKIASQQCVFEMYPSFQTKGFAGTLIITNFRLRFEPNQSISNQAPPMLYVAATRGMPIAAVSKLLYPQSNNGAAAVPVQLLIQFRNLKTWCLRGNVQELMLLLNRHCFSISAASLFAFARGNGSVSDYEGHKLYDIAKDFAGMGVNLGQKFRLTELNRDFNLCPTYPAVFGVPARMTDSQVAAVAEFRSKGRMPLLCWVHSSNSASLWRCAQPKRGIFHAQNSEDENMLLQIAQTNHINQLVWIVDCRPELNARANNLKGGGTESSSIRHATVTFMDIANIHAMRDSIDGVRALLLSQNPELDWMWNARVEETKWLFHIRRVLSTAIQTANAIHNTAQTVVVHCSDGWDRTAQVCALAQLLLDPRYRTLEGFFQLIEKEWIKAGHKFEDRIGAGRAENDENSPVFLQFLDCVWQLTRQYPTHFQFNCAALTCIFEHAISGRFGTFVCNCERERFYLNVAGRTPSLWSFMLNHRHIYTNPFYREYDSSMHRGEQGALIPPISLVLRRVVLWDELYGDPNIPSCGNPCPPQYQETTTYQPAATAVDDLAKAYEAAKSRIRDLEAQYQRQSTPVSAPMSAPTIPYTPVPRYAPPPAPAAIPHASSLDSMRTLMTPLEATWKCRLCTKVNQVNDLKCSVCGRSQG